MKKTSFILALSLILSNTFSCVKNSDSISSNDDNSIPYDLPLDNNEKELIFGDILGNNNGILEENERDYLNTIFQGNDEVWFISAMDIELTIKDYVTDVDLWWFPPRLYGPFNSIESIKNDALELVPHYLIFGIYAVKREPEYKFTKFYYSHIDSLNSNNWHEFELVDVIYD
jgi:starvation-inducible outer membrane lipoprotein